MNHLEGSAGSGLDRRRADRARWAAADRPHRSCLPTAEERTGWRADDATWTADGSENGSDRARA